MRVHHGRRHVGVAHQLLDGADVVARLQQVRGERVPQGVAGGWLGQAGATARLAHGVLHHAFVQVVAALVLRLGVAVPARGREHPLPVDVARGARILQRQRVGQRHVAGARGHVLRVQLAHARQLLLQRRPRAGRQHGAPVLAALAATHRQLVGVQVDVLDAQRQRLAQPQAGAVHQQRHQMGEAVQLAEQRRRLASRQHHRDASPRLRAHHVVQPRQLHPQHLAVQEQQRRQRLVLGRGRHVPLRRQVRQEGRHLRFTHFTRVSLAVEHDETQHPVRVRAPGAGAVVPGLNRCTHLVEQPGLAGRPWGGFGGVVHGLHRARAGPRRGGPDLRRRKSPRSPVRKMQLRLPNNLFKVS